MDKRKRNHITIAFIIVVVLAMALMLANSMHPTSEIRLPENPDNGGATEESTPVDGGALKIVEIQPNTVQYAIETLKRPSAYSRTIKIQEFWENGSESIDIKTAVKGGWNRTDRTLSDGRVRHALTDGRETYIWYGQSAAVYQGTSGAISADREQVIPTYEEILELPAEAIEKAEFCTIGDGVECIYVETKEDSKGYTNRYWVGTEHGLLVAAERLEYGETIYRMSGPTVNLAVPDGKYFTLPNGKAFG